MMIPRSEKQFCSFVGDDRGKCEDILSRGSFRDTLRESEFLLNSYKAILNHLDEELITWLRIHQVSYHRPDYIIRSVKFTRVSNMVPRTKDMNATNLEVNGHRCNPSFRFKRIALGTYT